MVKERLDLIGASQRLADAFMAPLPPKARANSITPPKPHLASFAVRAFIRFPVLLLASCDEYGRICNSGRDRRVITPKNRRLSTWSPAIASRARTIRTL